MQNGSFAAEIERHLGEDRRNRARFAARTAGNDSGARFANLHAGSVGNPQPCGQRSHRPNEWKRQQTQGGVKMIAVSKVSTATREVVDDLEGRFGRKRVYLFGGATVLIALLLLIRFATSANKKSPPPPPRPVSVAKAIARDAPLYLDEIGTCAAYESVQVQAQVSGQIEARHFKDGQDVKKGDLLFTIDPRPYQAVLDSAKADLMLAEANLKRQEELRAKAVTARQDWDTAEASAMKAQAAVDAAQVNLDFTQIRSPIDGRIGLRQVDVGNTVAAGMNGGAGGAVLVNIDNLDPIYTDFTIAEPDIPLVR